MKIHHDSELTHLIGNRAISAPNGVVPLAATTARVTTLQELEHPTALLELYETRNRLTRVENRLLPIEADLRAKIAPHLKRVEYDIARMVHAPEVDLPTLDPSFLSWKTIMGFPAFSVFKLEKDVTEEKALKSNICTISYRIDGRSKTPRLLVDPPLPRCMMEHFADRELRNGLLEHCRAGHLEALTLTARYGGAMPEEVRDKIHYYLGEEGFGTFDDIYLVAEAPGGMWEMKAIPERDPLVIGIAHGLLWLIAAFDLTPAELFARELCLNTARIPLN